MQSIFISDLHLGEDTPDIEHAFNLFIDHCLQHHQKIKQLFILGDFFEFWIGDDYQSEFTNRIYQQLQRLSRTDTQCYYMHGNRDFLLAEGFAQQSGFQHIADPYLLELDGRTILLSHGDDLCTDDHQYMQFKQMVRDPCWQTQFLSRTIPERIQLALDARRESQDVQQAHPPSSKENYIADVNQQAVVDLMQSHRAFCLIHGHTHRPQIHSFELQGKQACRIVLSDWYKAGSFLVHENGNFHTQMIDA